MGELLGFCEEGGFDAVVDFLDEGEGVLAVAGHAALEGEGGEVLVAEELGFFVAEGEDLLDEGGVVVGGVEADGGGGLPEGFAEFWVFGVLHDGGHGGGLEGEAVGALGEVFRCGVGGGGGFCGVWEAGEFCFVCDEEFPCVGGV